MLKTEGNSGLEFSVLFVISSLLILGIGVLRDHLRVGLQELIEFSIAPILLCLIFSLLILQRNQFLLNVAADIKTRCGIAFVLCAAILMVFFIGNRTSIGLHQYFIGQLPGWQGFGFQVLCLAVFIASIYMGLSYCPPINLEKKKNRLMVTATSIFFGGLAIWIYSLSFIQTSHGIINIGDATYFVIEEIIGPLVGKFPGINSVSSYTSLLGIPLLLVKPFKLGTSNLMMLVLIYINLLCVAVPVLLLKIIRTFYTRIPLGLLLLGILGSLQVCGSWGSVTGLTESLSRVPGRSLLPILLLYVYLKIQQKQTLNQNNWTHFAFGALGALTAWNNFEFGIPAFIAFLILVWVGNRDKRWEIVGLSLAGGAMTVSVLWIVLFFTTNGANTKYRLSLIGGGGLSNGDVRLAITGSTGLALSLLFVSSFVGIRELLTPSTHELMNLEAFKKKNAAITSTFFGLWGLLSFQFFALRSNGSYSLLHIFVVPAAAGLFALYPSRQRPFSRTFTSTNAHSLLQAIPFALICGLFFASVLQSPNPRDEIRRVLGDTTVAGWSDSAPLRQKSDIWTPDLVDFINPADLLNVVAVLGLENDISYFGFMGNSIEIVSGIPNVTGASGTEIMGTKTMADLTCAPIYRSDKKFIISIMPKALCPGLLKYKEINGWTVYVKSDN